MGSNSSKRRDSNRQRDSQFDSRAYAEERAWARWQNSSAQPGRTEPGAPAPDAELHARAKSFLTEALGLSIRGHEGQLLEAIESLTSSSLSSGRRAGVVVLEDELTAEVRTKFTEGWQPLDLAHVVAKLQSDDHRSVLVSVLCLEQSTTTCTYLDERWERQLRILDVLPSRAANKVASVFVEPTAHSLVTEMRLINEVRVGIELLICVRRLPKLPILLQRPSEKPLAVKSTSTESAKLDEKVLAKVRGLLAKAESTTFEEEADALTAKAQELMARHAIDLAMLDANAPSKSGVVARRVHVEDPYFEAKSVLLTIVAEANRCSAVTATQLGIVTVFGFATDLDITELLFTSLLMQATSSMVSAGRSVDRSGVSRTKSFRRTFIIAFASRIGERLREAGQSATDDARSTLGESFLPVLASREEQVQAHQAEMFPNVKVMRSSISNAAGWQAGREAADRASLHANTPIATRT